MFGVDYAFSPHPTIAALTGAHVKFVGRYASPSSQADQSGKNLQGPECRALLQAGLQIIMYAEWYAARMNEGRAAGIADAQHFADVTRKLGLDGIAMYCAADWDVSAAQQVNVNAYLDGAATVVGKDRTGIYGGFWAVSRALSGGHAKYAVQTYAWSTYGGGALPDHAEKWDVGGRTFLADKRANVRQSQIIRVGGAACDHLTSMTPDFGQFPRPHLGPYRHVVPAGNTVGFTELIKARSTDLAHLQDLAAKHLNPANLAVFEAAVALAQAMHAAGMPDPALPEGMVYFTTHP